MHEENNDIPYFAADDTRDVASPVEAPQIESNDNDDDNTSDNIVLSYFKSYDFVELMICTIFGVILCVTPELVIDPRMRPIPVQVLENNGGYILNLSYDEEYAGQTVSTLWLFILAFVAPLIIQALLSKLLLRIPGDTHSTICVYIVAMSITSFVTGSIKNYVGYLRPIFYSICEPNESYSDCTGEEEDVRRSFVSGHASMSFCGMTLISLYLLRNFGIYNTYATRSIQYVTILNHTPYGDSRTTLYQTNNKLNMMIQRIISIFCVSPMLLAFFIATSRVVDNKHFPADVVGGSVLGFGVAIFIHGMWFPPAISLSC